MRAEAEWLDRTADLLAAPLTALPHAELAAALNETFELVGCSFHDGPPGPGRLALSPRRGWTAPMRTLARRGIGAPEHPHPLLVYYAATLDDRPVQIADLPPPFTEPGLLGPWREFARPGGFAEVLVLPLRGHHRAFGLGRSRLFSPPETELAGRLWRLLRGLDRQVRALSAARLDPVAAAALLTPRETAVFGLVVDGSTAGTVARRLGIAERTVHKHLERIYRKLGASDRLTAVLRAQQAGLLSR